MKKKKQFFITFSRLWYLNTFFVLFNFSFMKRLSATKTKKLDKFSAHKFKVIKIKLLIKPDGLWTEQ